MQSHKLRAITRWVGLILLRVLAHEKLARIFDATPTRQALSKLGAASQAQGHHPVGDSVVDLSGLNDDDDLMPVNLKELCIPLFSL